MMKNKITAILILTILTIFFVAGCMRTTTKPTVEEEPESTAEETGDETINEISDDISDIDVMDDDLDTGDLDNLAQDLNDLDW
ncbi:MAG: hypothetical protein KKA61_04780 [Nanoarchaeota archaeon]|nr:hypothetical protein [Nanoarchaeota archaeon]MBU4284544.1 hypothetical protein [Nanoarchaeota archaeon]MBU4493661.1 hypothetical protein [Nanoarchaeota archaeon]